MINLKNEKGSITLFVLVSCLFLISSVVCMHIYMQSKQVAIDRQYRQIKSSYEEKITDTNILNETYSELSQAKNLDITIETQIQENNQIKVTFIINNVQDLQIQEIKYGWGETSSIDTVQVWNYMEIETTTDKLIAINNNISESGEYHLFVVIDQKEIYKQITI